MACVEATKNRIEQKAFSSAAALGSSSLSGNPLTRLNTLITASIAGDNGASSSSFPDISTYELKGAIDHTVSLHHLKCIEELIFDQNITEFQQAQVAVAWSIHFQSPDSSITYGKIYSPANFHLNTQK